MNRDISRIIAEKRFAHSGSKGSSRGTTSGKGTINLSRLEGGRAKRPAYFARLLINQTRI